MDTSTRLSVLEARNELICSLVKSSVGWTLLLTSAVVGAALVVNSQFVGLENRFNHRIDALDNKFDRKIDNLQKLLPQHIALRPDIQDSQ